MHLVRSYTYCLLNSTKSVWLFTMGTWSFPGVKRPGRGADHPPPSKCRGHERVELYLHSPSGPQWPVTGRTYLAFVWLLKYLWCKTDGTLKSGSFSTHKSVMLYLCCFRRGSYVSSLQPISQFHFSSPWRYDLVLLHVLCRAITWPNAICILLRGQLFLSIF